MAIPRPSFGKQRCAATHVVDELRVGHVDREVRCSCRFRLHDREFDLALEVQAVQHVPERPARGREIRIVRPLRSTHGDVPAGCARGVGCGRSTSGAVETGFSPRDVSVESLHAPAASVPRLAFDDGTYVGTSWRSAA